MNKSHKLMPGNCSDQGQEKKKTIDEIVKDIAELAVYEDELRDSERNCRHPVFCFKNPQEILAYIEGIAKSEMFEQKIDIPPNIANAKEMFGYLSESCSVGETSSAIGQHAEESDAYLRSLYSVPEKLSPPNKTVFIFRKTVHICDPHGDLQSVVDAVKEFCDEDGYLKKDVVILCHGDYMDRGKKSVETLLFFLKLKEAYGDQVQMLRGNHEDANVFASPSYGHWLNLFNGKNKFENVSFFHDFFEQLPSSALVMPVNKDGEMTSCSLAAHAGPLFFPNKDNVSLSEALAEPRTGAALRNSFLSNVSLMQEYLQYRFSGPNDEGGECTEGMRGKENRLRGCGFILDEGTVYWLKKLGVDRCVSGHVHKTIQDVNEFFYSSMVSGNGSPDAYKGFSGMRTYGVTKEDGGYDLVGLETEKYVSSQLNELENMRPPECINCTYGSLLLQLHCYKIGQSQSKSSAAQKDTNEAQYNYRYALRGKGNRSKVIGSFFSVDQKFVRDIMCAISLDKIESVVALFSLLNVNCANRDMSKKAGAIAQALAEECHIINSPQQ